jgi:HlyD family secretion protein
MHSLDPNFDPLSQASMDRKLDKRSWSTKRIVVATFALFLMAFILYSFFFVEKGSRLNVDVDRITISTVERGPFQEFVAVQGTVLPIETFYLDAIEGGRVEKIFVEAGSMVKRGDPILRLANTGLQLDVMYREALTYEQINNAQNRRLAIEQNTISVQSQLADVENLARQASLSFVRDSALRAKDLISPEEFIRSKNDFVHWQKRLSLARENFKQDSLLRVNQLRQLESSINRLHANLEMVRQSLSNLTVRAPISGQLSSLNAEIGQSKSAGQRLGQIDVLEKFKVRAAIDEFYISRINLGQNGQADVAGKRYSVVIQKVYPEVIGGRFEVDLEFVGEAPVGIRRGQTLPVRLELSELSEAILLPRGGFYHVTGGRWVYVLDRSSEFAVKRTITIGRQNPQMFEVLEGLEPGDRVITSSYDQFGNAEILVLQR